METGSSGTETLHLSSSEILSPVLFLFPHPSHRFFVGFSLSTMRSLRCTIGASPLLSCNATLNAKTRRCRRGQRRKKEARTASSSDGSTTISTNPFPSTIFVSLFLVGTSRTIIMPYYESLILYFDGASRHNPREFVNNCYVIKMPYTNNLFLCY